MAGHQSLRAAAARDPNFLGIDVDAMAALIRQMTRASDDIRGWLRGNAALPPGVSRAGVREAAAVGTWVNAQIAMLTRRRSYALAHLNDPAPVLPKAGPGRLGARGGSEEPRATRRRRTTPAGAGRHVGHFPDTGAATRAGADDGTAIMRAVREHRPVPEGVWRRLAANAGDPDYVAALYRRLGPAGTADLIAAALRHARGGSEEPRATRRHDPAVLTAIETSLGIASHHVLMTEPWLRRMLDEARRDGVREEALRVFERADLAPRTEEALARLGVTGAADPGEHSPKAAEDPPAAEDPSTPPRALREASGGGGDAATADGDVAGREVS